MEREGNHNNNTRARKGAKIQLPKLSRMNVRNGRHAGLWGEDVPRRRNLVGFQSQYTTPRLNVLYTVSHVYLQQARYCVETHEVALTQRLEA